MTLSALSPIRKGVGSILWIFLLLASAQPLGAASDDLFVTQVIDGDSFHLSNGMEVRLIGVDTPEMKDHQRNLRNAKRFGIQPKAYATYARAAKTYVQKQVLGKKIRLVFDETYTEQGHQDKYNRYLVYMMVESSGDGERTFHLNRRLIKEGYGLVYQRYPFKFKQDFIKDQEDAKEQQRGMWKHFVVR